MCVFLNDFVTLQAFVKRVITGIKERFDDRLSPLAVDMRRAAGYLDCRYKKG